MSAFQLALAALSLTLPPSTRLCRLRLPQPCMQQQATDAACAAWGPLPVPPMLLAALEAAGYAKPTPIQCEAMPLIAEGANVVLHAETGSGKTLAFLAPLLAALNPALGLQVLVVCPSQELAVQIATEARKLMAREDAVLLALSTSTDAEDEQRQRLQRTLPPVQLAVGTPQRLLDLLGGAGARGRIRQLRAVVLDEVDALLPPAPPGAAAATPGGRALGRGGRGAAHGAARGAGRGARGTARGAARGAGRGAARGAARGGRGGRGAAPFVHDGMQRRLSQKKPTEVLLERLARAQPGGATALQLVSCSATVDAPLRRQLGVALGGEGKKAAGVVVTAEPAHVGAATLKKRGVGGVSLPSTITHSAYRGGYRGKERAKLTVLQVAFEEHGPRAPLLVVPNGASLQAEVRALRAAGFDGAVALHEALGVPARGDAAAAAGGAPAAAAAAAAAAGASAQESMLARRQELATSFARSGAAARAAGRRSEAAAEGAAEGAAAAEEDEEAGGEVAAMEDDDEEEEAAAEAGGLGVPLLVTTEHAARGVDLKAVDQHGQNGRLGGAIAVQHGLLLRHLKA